MGDDSCGNPRRPMIATCGGTTTRLANDLRFRTQTFANLQLTTLLNAALRRVLGEVTFIQVVRDEPYQKVAKDSAQK